MKKDDDALKLWLVYDRANGSKKRYLAKKWLSRDGNLTPLKEEIETDDIESIRRMFLDRNYYILPKRFGIVIDIWVEPEVLHAKVG